MCTIGGVVALDLRKLDDYYSESEREAESKLKMLSYAPAGADIEIHVKARQMPIFQGLDYLRHHGTHLGSITVHCEDAGTVASWVKALREGTW